MAPSIPTRSKASRHRTDSTGDSFCTQPIATEQKIDHQVLNKYSWKFIDVLFYKWMKKQSKCSHSSVSINKFAQSPHWWLVKWENNLQFLSLNAKWKKRALSVGSNDSFDRRSRGKQPLLWEHWNSVEIPENVGRWLMNLMGLELKCATSRSRGHLRPFLRSGKKWKKCANC